MAYKTKVRHGLMKFVKDCSSEFSIKVGDKVVLDSDRGLEIGEVVIRPEESNECGACCKILRKVAEEDKKRQKEIEDESAPQEYKFCKEKIRERNLPMKLTTVEHLLDKKKIIFYFVSQGRVDFRELVKDLARQYHTRIEMRQIGVRDEARLLAQYQHCGRELCCKSWLKRLEPVTMKMAKNQKATLDPSKISGRCGRLMCCLRYENEVYEELRDSLPRKGSCVSTSMGEGRVIDYEILRQKVTIETKDDRVLVVDAKDIHKGQSL